MSAVEEVKEKYVRMTGLQEAQDQLSNSVTLLNSLVNFKVSKEEPVWQLQPQNFSSWKRLTQLYALVV